MARFERLRLQSLRLGNCGRGDIVMPALAWAAFGFASQGVASVPARSSCTR